jgi:hypothetical protein
MDQPMPSYAELMTRFRAAYHAVDAAVLGSLIAPDFEWHLDWFPAEDPVPTGKVLYGVDEMIAELQRRKRAWSNLRYRDLNERFLPGFIVQTFFVSGVDQDAGSFDIAAVDLYSLKSDRIWRKDTYWKRGRFHSSR